MAEKESSALPASGLALVVALLFGYVAVHEGTLERYRPIKAEKNSEQVLDLQDADARLWQDPLAAAQRHHEELQRALDAGKPTEWTQRHAARHRFKALAGEITNTLEKAPLTIVGVTVSSAPYAEDVERRQRNRYATLAGLNRAALTPDNGDHIGYVVTRGGDPGEKCPGNIDLLPDKIPYEWFSPTTERPQEAMTGDRLGRRRVLVLWLGENALTKKPIESLAALSGCLGLTADTANVRIRVLGPASSDTLRAIVSEHAGKQPPTGPQIQIYSPIATASNDALLEGLGDQARIPFCARPGEMHERDVCVLRTIVTDDKLAESIVLELEKRGVRLRPQCARTDGNCTRDRVALISEWDTFYGRSLPDAIGRILCPNTPRQCDTIVRRSYLQGIDGTVPGESSAQPTAGGGASKADQKDVTKETARGERADGRHQFDYLRRLTDDVRQQNAVSGKGRITAIGILGSDVYDKLLVLQALRNEFPQAQYFTTDVDARLLHPQEFKWARNLVVASGFGLQLRKELQGDIPPFRDTYQTSLFFSTLLALAADTSMPDQKQVESRMTSRIFETGRRHAYPLDRDRATGPCDPHRPLVCTSIHPDSPDFVPPGVRNGWLLYIPALLLLAVVVLPFFSAYRRGDPKQDLTARLEASDEDRKAGITSRIAPAVADEILARRRTRALRVFVLTSLALVPVLHLAAVLLLELPFNEEPLTFYEGISLWPTEALRFFAGILAIFLTYWAMLRMEKNQIALTGWFFPACRTLGLPEFDFNRQGVWTSIVTNLHWKNLKRILACDLLEGQTLDAPDERLNAEVFWRQYMFHSSLAASAIRTTLAATVYLAFAMSLLLVMGLPHTPYRGEFSLIVDRIAVLAWSTPLLLFLTFYVVDATLLCKRFIAALSDRHTEWPEDTRKHYGASATGTDTEMDEAYDDWIDIRLIAERTAAISSLVYYPLLVMIVLLFARSTLFDMWHWPAGLVVPLVISVIILFACYIALRRQAEAARSIALAKVARRLLVAKGQGAASGTLASQLELMHNNIDQIREGAFALFTQQPLVKALLIFISASGLAMLEYFGIISF